MEQNGKLSLGCVSVGLVLTSLGLLEHSVIELMPVLLIRVVQIITQLMFITHSSTM